MGGERVNGAIRVSGCGVRDLRGVSVRLRDDSNIIKEIGLG